MKRAQFIASSGQFCAVLNGPSVFEQYDKVLAWWQNRTLIVIFISSVLLLLASSRSFGQGSYTSANNNTALWSTASAWTKEFSWMTNPPPPNPLAGSYVANIYGYITHNGALSATGGSKINVYDTLVIMGNFTVASSVEVHPGGILIVIGNFTSTSSSGNKLINNGDVVVTGEFSHSGGNITTNDRIYSYDSSPFFTWGANVDGIGYTNSPPPNNSAVMGAELDSEAELIADNLPLYNFVNGILAPAPVTVLSFSAVLDGDVVRISWSTSREEGFERFELERTSDATRFVTIADVQGAGYDFDELVKRYEVTDASPKVGKNYYRLKAIDLDGTVEYFGMVAVDVSARLSVSWYPNPVSTNAPFSLSANFNLDDGAAVEVVDLSGTPVLRQTVDAFTPDLSIQHSLTPGTYVIHVTAGSNRFVSRLVVK